MALLIDLIASFSAIEFGFVGEVFSTALLIGISFGAFFGQLLIIHGGLIY